jgi:serpin B
MMSQKDKYNYYENEQFQAVSLPYGKEAKISFYVFLPKQNYNLKSFYQNLNAENWEKWMSQFSQQEGFIRLPRFKMDYEVTLNEALKVLGMGEAFTNQADFSGIGENLAISDVKHKTFVEVNEEGTEAAATTSVGIVATSLPANEPFRMIVDRPFFCAIRDNQTGSILFMGSIVDPQA